MYETDPRTGTEENSRSDWESLKTFRGFRKGEQFTVSGHDVTVERFALNHAWCRYTESGESALLSYAEIVNGEKAVVA